MTNPENISDKFKKFEDLIFQKKDYPAAIKLSEELLKADPYNFDIYMNLVRVYDSMLDNGKANEIRKLQIKMIDNKLAKLRELPDTPKNIFNLLLTKRNS